MKPQALAIVALAVAIGVTGCGKKEDQQTQARLDEMQKKLDETQKQLDEAKTKAATQEPAAAQTGQPVETAAKAPAPPPEPPPEPAAKPKPAPPKIVTIPAGTTVQVRTIGTISTKTATQGSTFEATLAQPLVAGGTTIAPKGADVVGVVTSSDSGGRVKGTASLGLALRSIELSNGKSLPVSTSALTLSAGSSKKRDAAKIGIGAGVGAAIGAIAGGGSGAAIGAGAGAAGGTGLVLATKGKAAEVPAESLLSFKLSAPAQVK